MHGYCEKGDSLGSNAVDEVMQCKLMTKKNKQATHKTAKFVYMYKCVNHDAPPP